MEIKAKINKWDPVKPISFCGTKETINKKTTYRLQESIAHDVTNKDLNS